MSEEIKAKIDAARAAHEAAKVEMHAALDEIESTAARAAAAQTVLVEKFQELQEAYSEHANMYPDEPNYKATQDGLVPLTPDEITELLSDRAEITTNFEKDRAAKATEKDNEVQAAVRKALQDMGITPPPT